MSLAYDTASNGERIAELSVDTERCVQIYTKEAQAKGLSGFEALEYVMAEMFTPWNDEPAAGEPEMIAESVAWFLGVTVEELEEV